MSGRHETEATAVVGTRLIERPVASGGGGAFESLTTPLIAKSRCPNWALYIGLWLFVSSVYALTSAGRIDMIDAEWKVAVTSAIVEHGQFFTNDAFLAQWYPKPLCAGAMSMDLGCDGKVDRN